MFLIAECAVLYVAPDAFSACRPRGCHQRYLPVNFGLHEFRCQMQQGIVKIGHYDVVVCVLGRADVTQGRTFPAVFEKFVKAFNVLGPHVMVIMLGPLPLWGEDPQIMLRLHQARNYIAARTTAEHMFQLSTIADRFGDPRRGPNPHLLSEDGLTERGAEVLEREVLDLLTLAEVEGFCRR